MVRNPNSKASNVAESFDGFERVDRSRSQNSDVICDKAAVAGPEACKMMANVLRYAPSIAGEEKMLLLPLEED